MLEFELAHTALVSLSSLTPFSHWPLVEFQQELVHGDGVLLGREELDALGLRGGGLDVHGRVEQAFFLLDGDKGFGSHG